MQTLYDFARECYMRSEPSIDLNDVTEAINSWDHKLQYSIFAELVEKFADGDNERRSASLMWCLNQGPTIINC